VLLLATKGLQPANIQRIFAGVHPAELGLV
jgi:hypothetical protein